MTLAPDFDEFCALLSAHGVEFVIVGAHALAFHGAPRFTAAFGFPTAPISALDVAGGTKVVEMGLPPVQIHVMSHLDGVTWDEVWNGRENGVLGSRAVAFIGRDAFLRNKRAAGRPKDLADVEALREPDER